MIEKISKIECIQKNKNFQAETRADAVFELYFHLLGSL